MEASKEKLAYGEVSKMERNGIGILIYDTKDEAGTRVIFLVKDGKAVMIEHPGFKKNITELSAYLQRQDFTVVSKLVSYHAAGASFLPDAEACMTESARAYNDDGVGAQLVEDFASIYGFTFDDDLVRPDRILPAGETEIAGIRLEIVPVAEAYEIVIPEANAVYMHMLGHDSHSIVFGVEGAESEVRRLQGYLDRGIDMFLSSHHDPEGREDVDVKIAYLNDLKEIAATCRTCEQFASKVLMKYNDYDGKNFVEMSSWFFFDLEREGRLDTSIVIRFYARGQLELLRV